MAQPTPATTFYTVCRCPETRSINQLFTRTYAVLLPRTSVHRGVCPTCSVCLLQFMLGQCWLGHHTRSPRLQHLPEVLLQPESTREEPKPLFETDAWPATRPDSSKRSWFHQFRLLWLVPAFHVVLNTARWFIRVQGVPVTLSK